MILIKHLACRVYQSGTLLRENLRKLREKFLARNANNSLIKWWRGLARHSEKKTDAVVDSGIDVPYTQILNDYLDHREFTKPNSRCR